MSTTTQETAPQSTPDAGDESARLYAKHRDHAQTLEWSQQLMNNADEARATVREARENGTLESVPYETRVFANGEHTQQGALDAAQKNYDANMWRAHEFARLNNGELQDIALSEAEANGKTINLAEAQDIGGRALEYASRIIDGEQPELVEILPGIEQGEQVRFQLGFNKERLAQLDPETLIDQQKRGREVSVERLRAMLDTFSKLPDDLRFEPGATAIFGENGAGKTVLADSIIVAIQMEQYRIEKGVSREDIKDSTETRDGAEHFSARLPGRMSTGEFKRDDERAHRNLITKIARCFDVDGAVLHDPSETVGAGIRTQVALGNALMGMSTRQSVDLFTEYSNGNHERWSTSIMLLDEPELGLSPARHKNLASSLESSAKEGSVILVPTNSPILHADRAIPRIDLDEPEKGVHYPS